MESSSRILSVDNDPGFRKSLSDYLEDSGFTIFEASSNKEALKLFREKKPDVILSSLQMEGEKGVDLLDNILQESPETPVIVMSETEKLDNLLEALRLGAWDYIIKPIKDLAVLEHTVCRALEKGRLSLENRRYRQALEEKNIELGRSLLQLRQDQQAGKSVQQQLLPKSNTRYGDYIFSQKVLPSLYLSGDFVDYFEISNNLIGFYIVDVSGHGASSAFITVLIKSLIEQLLVAYQIANQQTILHPNEVLKYISDIVLASKLGKYLTMVFCLLNKNTNQMRYSVGGHYPNPIIVEEGKPSFLEGRGFALGVFDKAHFETRECSLKSSTSICLLTDGVFELIEGENSEEKEQTLLDIVSKAKGSFDSILNKIEKENESGLPDDIAVLSVRRGLA